MYFDCVFKNLRKNIHVRNAPSKTSHWVVNKRCLYLNHIIIYILVVNHPLVVTKMAFISIAPFENSQVQYQSLIKYLYNVIYSWYKIKSYKNVMQLVALLFLRLFFHINIYYHSSYWQPKNVCKACLCSCITIPYLN